MKRKSFRKRSSEVDLGFQIAPMIDVVFVILMYFMVAAGNAQKESSLKSDLPTYGATDIAASDPVEIRIERDGQILLNQDPLDTPDSKKLPELKQSIREIRKANEAIEFILSTAEQTKYQRVVDVLDVLTAEKITRVSFQAADEE